MDTFASKVLTISDGVVAGTRIDSSGVAVAECLAANGFLVEDRLSVGDGRESVAEALIRATAGFHGLVVTTGGTGFGARDETPEGTIAVIQRTAPGLAEAMRAVNPLGRLSRGTAGTRDRALILNLPGSPKGAVEQLTAVIDILPHAIGLLADNSDPHPDTDR